MTTNADETKSLYKALKLFNNLAYSKDFLLEIKLENGKYLFVKKFETIKKFAFQFTYRSMYLI